MSGAYEDSRAGLVFVFAYFYQHIKMMLLLESHLHSNPKPHGPNAASSLCVLNEITQYKLLLLLIIIRAIRQRDLCWSCFRETFSYISQEIVES